jgi:hypothetical protein
MKVVGEVVLKGSLHHTLTSSQGKLQNRSMLNIKLSWAKAFSRGGFGESEPPTKDAYIIQRGQARFLKRKAPSDSRWLKGEQNDNIT